MKRTSTITGLLKVFAFVTVGLCATQTTNAQVVYAEDFGQNYQTPGPGPAVWPTQSLPQGWTQGKITPAVPINDPLNYVDRVNAGTFPNCSPTSSPGMLRYGSYWIFPGEEAFVISRPIDLSARGAASSKIRFRMYRDGGEPLAYDSVSVYASTSPTFAYGSATALSLQDTTGTNLRQINRYTGFAPATVPVAGVDGWYKYGFTIPAGAPFTASQVYIIIKTSSRFGNNIFIDDFEADTYPGTQAFSSYTIDQQNAANAGLGAVKQWIIGLRAVATGALTPRVVNTINFTSAGTNNPATDVVNARLWFTGGTGSFDSLVAVQVGSTLPTIGVTFSITGVNVPLHNGNNYFWLTYDVPLTATTGNFLDAELVSIASTPAGPAAPALTTLAGARQIDLAYCIPNYFVGTAWSNYGTGGQGNDYCAAVNLVGESGTQINNTINDNCPGVVGPGCGFSAHPPDYQRFPAIPNRFAIIREGSTYTLSATVGTYFAGNCLAAWIDFDHNASFNNTLVPGAGNEKIFQTVYPPGLANNGVESRAFTVPAGSYLGATTLRVREAWINNNITPCNTYTYGETEDYTVIIVPDCNLIPGGWKVWLGGFDDDWNNNLNWCGGVPSNTTTDIALITDPVASGGAVAPVFWPVIKKNVTALARRIRIEGTGSLTADASINSSLTIGDSLIIAGAASSVNIISAKRDSVEMNNGKLTSASYLSNPFGGVARQRMFLRYTAGELLAMGLEANDVIDSIFIVVRQRRSTTAYQNFSINYFYGPPAPALGLPTAATTPWPGLGGTYPQIPVGAVTNVFTGNIDLTTSGPPEYTMAAAVTPTISGSAGVNTITVGSAVGIVVGMNVTGTGIANGAVVTSIAGAPIITLSANNIGAVSGNGDFFAGKQIKIRLLTPIVWSNTTNPLILEICYDNPGAATPADQSYYTVVPGGIRAYYVIQESAPSVAIPGCTMNPTNAASRFSNSNRPNVTFSFKRNYIKFPINIAGPWRNDGTFNRGWSNVTFNGGGTQFIMGASPTTFNDLTLNKGANIEVIQNTAAVVDSFMTLTGGIFRLNARTLTLNYGDSTALKYTGSGSIRSEDLPPNYGLVNWKNIGSSVQTYVFPFRTLGSTLIPFSVNINGGTGHDLTAGTYTPTTNPTTLQPWPTGVTNLVNYQNNPVANTNANTVRRFWVVTDPAASPAGDFTFTYDPAESPGAGAVWSQRWAGAGPLQGWQPYTSGQSNPSGSSNLSPSITNWNTPWVLTLTTAPLPIELLSFTAKPVGSRVQLDWVTATEINNNYFSVDRTQGNDYSFINEMVPSQGASTSPQSYRIFDEKPLFGTQYYRLKQVDYNGDSKTYGPVAVTFGKKDFNIVSVVDNETNSYTVVFNYDSELPYSYQLIDAMGRIVTSGNNMNAQIGINNLEINQNLAAGVYTVVISNTDQIASKKFFK